MQIAMQTDEDLLEAIVEINEQIQQHASYMNKFAAELCNK
jgi:hypothetical protein